MLIFTVGSSLKYDSIRNLLNEVEAVRFDDLPTAFYLAPLATLLVTQRNDEILPR